MLRPNLDDLPEMPPLPDGYRLRAAGEDDAQALAALLAKSFEDPGWNADRTNKVLLAAPDVDRTFVVDFEGKIVATASAQNKNRAGKRGTVHFVGADADHAGKRLGYIVTLAVLQEFRRLGHEDADLSTDDWRLQAIKTYLNLGFQPLLTDPTHPERWDALQPTLNRPIVPISA
jgi:mycothiol synthase